ncbi:hypothetical protein T10_11625 [Trichinella papuae]|uniref:Uncharacterized protein n=1 Tax=Trichinella papuae TaxID=268474 RepID=A0A0V1MC49_9BILA|nr:hypothetical protein T10_11625 [Trichinella papuae]
MLSVLINEAQRLIIIREDRVKESDSHSNNFHLLHPATSPSFLPPLLPHPAFPSNDPHHRALNDSKLNRDRATENSARPYFQLNEQRLPIVT